MADRDRIRVENARLRAALVTLWTCLWLDEGQTHEKFGEACGEDACVLCLALGTAVAALAPEGEGEGEWLADRSAAEQDGW